MSRSTKRPRTKRKVKAKRPVRAIDIWQTKQDELFSWTRTNPRIL